jgi:hypothetical protein
MKKLLSILFILFTLQSFAQGNLQFNQVLTYSGSINCGQTSPTWTVPAGKVWKIEYRSIVTGNPNYDSGNNTSPSGPLFNLNGTKLSDFHHRQNVQPSNSTNLTSDQNLPLWLKAGDQIQFSLDNNILIGCGEYSKYNYAISILEYNIIP